MPLKITRRKDTGAFTIVGTVAGQRVRLRAQSDDRRLAEEEAAALEAKLLRAEWHGERRGARSFAEAVVSYLSAEARSASTKGRLNRILKAMGDIPLSAVTQERVDRLRQQVLGPKASPATVRRGLIVPIRAVLRHAHRRGWCGAPSFDIPRQPQGRTLYLLPSEAHHLVQAAAPHLRPLIHLLIGTGARMAEALELDWRDVDLAGARVIFWRTKGQKRRIANMPPSVVAALSALPHRTGAVFQWRRKESRKSGARKPTPRAYADRGRQGGGQIKTAWRGAVKRAGVDPALTPHDLRHVWASWRYALHRDLLRLKVEGAWSSVALVERYAHLLPEGHEAEIRAFWHLGDTAEGTGANVA